MRCPDKIRALFYLIRQLLPTPVLLRCCMIESKPICENGKILQRREACSGRPDLRDQGCPSKALGRSWCRPSRAAAVWERRACRQRPDCRAPRSRLREALFGGRSKVGGLEPTVAREASGDERFNPS